MSADCPLWCEGRSDSPLERRLLLADAGAELVVPAGSRRTSECSPSPTSCCEVSVELDAALIARLEPRCVGLVTYSVSTDGIDLDVATAAGIAVRNVPDYCTAEVADGEALLVLTSIRRLPHWLDTTHAAAVGCNPRTGAGADLRRTGEAHRRRHRCRPDRSRRRRAAPRRFGATTIAFDPFIKGSDAELRLVSKDELLARSDVIVVYLSSKAGHLHQVLDAAGRSPRSVVRRR